MVKRVGPLDPYARSTLRDVLVPPDGYQLENAIGTAYSLDAETLITVPLFAAGMAAEDCEKSVGIAKIYDLGKRIFLLVQGDRIAISKRWAGSRPLLRLVADAVVPCSVRDGSFHPKLLVLQFSSTDQQPAKKVFRVVVATRNLTTDNSWDSVVVLDQDPSGVLIRGLAETVGGLAQFVNDSSHPAASRCRQFGRSLKKVRFQPLPGVTDLEVRLFHQGSKNAHEVLQKIKGDDLLIISPFVRQKFLEDLASQAGAGRRDHRWLVTRPVDVPATAFDSYQVFQIADAAVPTHDLSDASDLPGRLVGLHAKIYLASTNKGGTRIVVTSANATPSGWTRNVEVAVTGMARAKAFQIPNLLAERDAAEERDPGEERNFRSLLQEISVSAVEIGEKDPEWIKNVRSALAGATAVGTVQKGPPRTLEVTVKFPSVPSDWPENVRVTMHPFGYGDRCAQLTLRESYMRGSLEIEPGIELTPFAVLILAHDDDPAVEIVLAMSLQGDLDWGRDDARATLARAARPKLFSELLWYFGVRGQSRGLPGHPAGKVPVRPGGPGGTHLPILEKVLLRVHGPNAQDEIETIDSLLAGLSNDAEDARLLALWQLVKESSR